MEGLTKRQQINSIDEKLGKLEREFGKRLGKIEDVLFPESEIEVVGIKELDQSVFFGQDEKFLWASVDKDGSVWLFREKPSIGVCDNYWSCGKGGRKLERKDFKPLNWRESVLRRSNKTYTGNELCLLLLQAGEDVMCEVSMNHALDKDHKVYDLIRYKDDKGFKGYSHYFWTNVTPVNRNGEELRYEDLF